MKMLTTAEVANRLGVTVQRIHQFIRDERLPAQKIGRDYIINEGDLKLLSDRQTGRPPKTKAPGSSGVRRAATKKGKKK